MNVFRGKHILSRVLKTQHANYSTFLNKHPDYVKIHPAVVEAITKKQPVVALESTIITHGMNYPHNYETATSVEQIVRDHGAIPATIAIIDGIIRVGLSSDDIHTLASNKNKDKVLKTSARELPMIITKKLSGGTTVSATSTIAEMVGIEIFATGGVGGVHRDFNYSMDVSSDLNQLGSTSIAVVSSGIKSILDIPKTLEYLETQGVFVATYQCEDMDFPAFYTRRSGVKVQHNFANASDAANAVNVFSHFKQSMIIGVPIPYECALKDEDINDAITSALKYASDNGITGKEVTPILLSRVAEVTQGKSLNANIALIKNNAKVAAEIAVELSKLRNGEEVKLVAERNHATTTPLVIGGTNVDTCIKIEEDFKLDSGTYKSNFTMNPGGVAFNIAECLTKIHGGATLLTAIGDDLNGAFVKQKMNATALYDNNSQCPSGTCTVIFDQHGDCKTVLAAMEIHKMITPDFIRKHSDYFQKAPLIVFDGNLPMKSMETVLQLCKLHHKPAFFEPTDIRLAAKPYTLPKDLYQHIKFISPNEAELNTIVKNLGWINDGTSVDDLDVYKSQLTFMLRNGHVDNLLLTCGPHGALVGRHQKEPTAFFNVKGYSTPGIENRDTVAIRCYKPLSRLANIVNVSGAGDSFSAGFIAAMLHHCAEDVCVSVAFEAARKVLLSTSTVADEYFKKSDKCWTTAHAFERFL